MNQISFVLWLVQPLLIFLFWRRLPPQLPLFYSRPWGGEQLSKPQSLLFLPVLSLIILFVNFSLAKTMAKEEKLISFILKTTASLFNILCLITLTQIIKLFV